MPSVCLAMIVRNEAAVVARCLASVRPLIDAWAVVDTGSTDGTQDLVRAALAGLPGELVERPWVDFGHNRTEAMRLARPRADYTLVIDADDTIEAAARPHLDAACYTVEIADAGTRYRRRQLVRNDRAWRYEGVLHEFLCCDGEVADTPLPGVLMHRNGDGARRRDPAVFRRDAAILQAALERGPTPFLRARYSFYLAQSLADAGDPAAAIAAYRARAAMGFWAEEIYVSLLRAGRLMTALDHPAPEMLAVFAEAQTAVPHRAEALHAASALCRATGDHAAGYDLAAAAAILPLPADGLFLEPWVYRYGAQDERAIHAFWTGRHRESLGLCLDLLGGAELPDSERARVARNARFAADALGG